MARPPKLNAEWFTHMGGLRNDRRVKAIRTATGAAGYGIFHMVLEALTDADYTTLSVDAFELELLAGDFGVSVTEIDSLLQIGQRVGYFLIDEANMLTCPELNKWLEMHFEKRNRSRNRGSGDKLPQPVTETGVSVTEIPHNTIQYNTIHNTTPTHPTPAAEGCVLSKKNEGEVAAEKLPAEGPDASASHTRGGGADVATLVEFQPEPEWAEPMRRVAAQMIAYWGLAEYQQQPRMALTRFCRTLFQGGQGEVLQQQFTAYRAYKELTGERRHDWDSFIGKEAEQFQNADAGWLKTNWVEALAAARQNPKYASAQHRHSGGPAASAGRATTLDRDSYTGRRPAAAA
ncbi:Lin1244/Lin1753 domain-containing protein [Hymenobacter sediminicola]|uniref:DUF4373 domain-containing protein n=1 Tax=Hymenobacter sediminicola TaxID=2761579 RepID=A0A7G7W2Y2_9BACT|nr:Lin1244/Lin1753 domain-containing protein [Hymenobacter sediminicola]QNH60725.1 DUF4373 domain-containing protein [Hymenobacter sediminicola]